MEREVLPFYLAYPGRIVMPKNGYGGIGLQLPAENVLLQDLKYFEQLYPKKVKRYQQKIAGVLDRLDFEGSMIYDEYPDRFSIEKLVENIAELLSGESQNGDDGEETFDKEKEKPLVFVLCGIEVYKRRHGTHSVIGSQYAGRGFLF